MNLDEINKRLKRTNIKGKDYIEVNQRVLAFKELYPCGSIETEKLHDDGKRCDFKATVRAYDSNTDQWVTIATGHAFEFQGANMVNKTSYVENAETSAVGRALGFLGIGITESIASADEVKAAIEHQEKNEQPTDDLAELWKKCLKAGISKDGLNGWYIANGYEGRKLGELDDKERKHVESYLNDMLESAERLRNEH